MPETQHSYHIEGTDTKTGRYQTNETLVAAMPFVPTPLSSPPTCYDFPVPAFAKAKYDQRGRKLPQVIAHRGYKARFPENSLLAFREAVKAGATALEADVRLTKDKIAILSHDNDLKRVFGHQKKVSDCMWDEIKDLKTMAQPPQPLARLDDLLKYLQDPECRAIWLLLDVKPDEEEEPVLRQIESAIARVPCQTSWSNRIVLGLWAPKQLPLAAKVFPDIPAIHTGFNLPYAKRHFPHMGSLLLIETLLSPGGSRMIRNCQAESLPIMAWVVNDEDQAKWCARRGLDGIVTDDPKQINQIWERFHFGKEPFILFTLRVYLHLIYIWYMVNFRFDLLSKKLKLAEQVSGSNGSKDKES